MRNTIKISLIMMSSLALVSLFAYVTFDELISPRIESHLFGECELKIFSGDDGTCIQQNQVAYLDWSSIESCTQTDNIIRCDPNVYPEIFTITPEECAELFDASWSDWVDYAKKAQSDGVQWEPPSKQGIVSGSEYFAEFRDTDCRFMVDDWAYLSADEKTVWRDIPWPELKTYPHEHLNYGDVMVLEAFPKSNPLKGNHYLHQIKLGEYPYLWEAIRHGNVILDLDEADQFLREFSDKSDKFEMHMPDGTTQIWRMTYGEKHIQNDQHLVEAIVFASDIPGDAPNMPYVEIPEEMVPIIAPLTERGKQFRYQDVSHDDAVKIYKMLDSNGIMFTMNNEKLFLKYLGPLLKSTNLDDTTTTSAEKIRTASYYPNKIPLPNGKFDERIEKVLLWNMMKELERHDIKNWRNDPDTGAHTDEGWMNPSKMCSKIFLEDKTEYYVSAEFYSEPELNITEIVIDNLRPTECQKWFWIPYEIKFENGNMVYEYEKLVETTIGN